MASSIDAARAARLVTTATPASDRELAELLSRPGANTLVRELLTWPDAAVRFWALDAAQSTLSPDDYLTALKAAMRDRDDGVSQEAVGRLVDLEPDAVRPVAKKLARKLTTDISNGEKVFVLWTLAKLRATDQLTAIETFRRELPEWWQLARVADVVLTYLKVGAGPMLDAIRDHLDHARMEELCTLAWHVIRTQQAEDALRLGSKTAPDDSCRNACLYALGRFATG